MNLPEGHGRAPSKKPPRRARRREGKALRLRAPHAALAEWSPAGDRPDVCATFELSNVGRIPHLLPLRVERMSASSFAWLRGAAGVMAIDLWAAPNSGIEVMLCGDCHLNNFGRFISPEQRLLFDLNDFDESHPGPFEWDVKRLTTSILLAARNRALGPKVAAQWVCVAVASYRQWIGRFAKLSPFALANYQLHIGRVLDFKPQDKSWREQARRAIRDSRENLIEQQLDKVVADDRGRLHLRERPNRLFHLPADDPFWLDQAAILADYRRSLQPDRRFLLEHYEPQDFAFKAAGVGSVALRDGLWLLADADGARLTLQAKEARPSVFATAMAVEPRDAHQGRRIVEAQRLLQSASDRFLGWAEVNGRHYYVRHWRDMKGSIHVDRLNNREFAHWIELCGWALARAHAKSGDAATLSGYLGRGESFDRAMLQFSLRYAEQVERDYQRFTSAYPSA